MNLRALLTDHLAYKAISLVLALGAWFLAQDEQILHATIEAPVDYLHPEGESLILMNDGPLPNPVILRVSGSRTAVSRLVEKAREVEIRYVVDMRDAEPGRAVHSFLRPPGGLTDAVQVDTISPAEVGLVYDSVVTVTLPVLLRTRGKLPPGFVETRRSVLPLEVTLTGSMTDLKDLEFVQTVPLRLDDLKENFSGTVSLDLAALHLVTNSARGIQVNFDVEEARSEHEFAGIQVALGEEWAGYDIAPASCVVRLVGPVPVLDELRRRGLTVRLDGNVNALVFPENGDARVAYSPGNSGELPAVRVLMDHPRAREIELRSVEPLTFIVTRPPPAELPPGDREAPQ
jgi:hypothetical protein